MKELKASEALLLDGVLTPNAILKDPTLSAGARLLWVLLAEYQGKVPECYPSQEMLAVPLGVKVRQLQSFIKELVGYTRGDPPEPFPLIEVKLVFVEKDRKNRNIYNLLRWPFLAVDLKANAAERSHLTDGGDAQYSAHRSEGEAQDAAAAPPAMPSEDGGAVTNGDAQGIAAALPEMLVRMAAWHGTECHRAIRNPLRFGLSRLEYPVKTLAQSRPANHPAMRNPLRIGRSTGALDTAGRRPRIGRSAARSLPPVGGENGRVHSPAKIRRGSACRL